MRLYYTRSQGSYYKCERYVGVSGCLSLTSIFVIDLWWSGKETTVREPMAKHYVVQWLDNDCNFLFEYIYIYIWLLPHACSIYIFIPLATQFSPHVKVWYCEAFFMECIWSTTLLFNSYMSRWVGWLVTKLTSLSLRFCVLWGHGNQCFLRC